MFSNLINNYSPGFHEKNSKSSIYYRFQNLLGRTSGCIDIEENKMLSARSGTVASDESFKTSVSSVGDLMALSPKLSNDMTEQSDVTSDLLTGAEFDSICDVTMQEVPHYDDMFIDATSLDYLVKCAESNRNHNLIDRGKESLFVKFDPLYARKFGNASSHTELVADYTEADGGYETGSAISVSTDVAMPKHTMSVGSMHSVGIKDKPMQVVPPVVNSEAAKPISNLTRSTPALTRSVSAILTPTQVTTDKLINFAGSSPPTAAPRSPRYHNYSSQEGDRLQTVRHLLKKQDQEVLQLRQENRELKSLLQDGEHNHHRTIEHLEAKVKKLKEEKEALLDRENKLLQQINDKMISNKQMSIVMEEYEKTISSLIGEQQREKVGSMETVERLTIEKEQALNHLTSMEGSFNDLLSKYERGKSVILETREREKIYEQKLAEYEAGIQKYESLYNDLKQVTEDKLSNANDTLDIIKKNHNVEVTKLNAIIKKHEITIASLHESVVQKTRDNEELTRICDQLINEVR